MASNLTPLRKGKRRAPRDIRTDFRAGKPVPNLLRNSSQKKWNVKKKGKLVKLKEGVYAIEHSFKTSRERIAHITAVRKLRQFCKTHPFQHVEFSPVYVKTVDGKGNRVLEQAIFAPSIDEVSIGFPTTPQKVRTMSKYKRLLLRKLAQRGIDPKKVSSLALVAVLQDITRLSDALFREGIRVNLGEDYKNILVTDYNSKTGKLVISIAGNVTDPYSIF